MTTERMVQLALSQKAALLLVHSIEDRIEFSHMTNAEEAIFLAIKRDIDDQIEVAKPKTKPKKAKKKGQKRA